ncbi:isoprenoid biosynthesis glyoxalase ElbB [bacterium]|nr:isoprenoid biosynthesis glyoxalase ElbB [bacterium]
MPRVAVVLSGCGRMDGSEVHESTLCLLYLAQGGARYQCFAPDESQVEVVNHCTQEPVREVRNQMVEAARIARGDILPLVEANADDFDAVVMPGGSGAFKNLSRGPEDINRDLKGFLNAMADAGKPIAAICIAPILAARALGDRGIRLTIGNDPETARLIEETGARHVECPVDGCVADERHKIVSAPAYMLGPGIADVAKGIEAAVKQLLRWCE